MGRINVWPKACYIYAETNVLDGISVRGINEGDAVRNAAAYTIRMAEAECGNTLLVLIYAVRHDIKFFREVYRQIASTRRGVIASNIRHIFVEAMVRGNLPVVKFIAELGAPLRNEDISYADMSGRAEVADYLRGAKKMNLPPHV